MPQWKIIMLNKTILNLSIKTKENQLCFGIVFLLINKEKKIVLEIFLPINDIEIFV